MNSFNSLTAGCYYTNQIYHLKEEKKAAPLTGWHQIEAQEMLTKMTAREFTLLQQRKLNRPQLDAGNLGHKISEVNARVIRHRALKKQDIPSDSDYNELEIMYATQKNTDSEMIQYLSKKPFFLLMVNQRNIEKLAQRTDILEECILNLDATGGVVKQIKISEKRIFFYVLVIRTPPTRTNDSGNLIELGSAISGTHDQIFIGQFLSFFKSSIFCYFKKWPVWKRVTSDFSFANMNAVMINFNSIKLIDYITMKYKEWANNDVSKHVLMDLSLCVAHIIKNFSRDLDKIKNFTNIQKRNLKTIFGNMCLIRNFDQLINFLFKFFKIIGTKRKDEIFERNFSDMSKICESSNFDEIFGKLSTETMEEDIDEITNDNIEQIETLYKKSPFYQFGDTIFQQVLDKNDDYDDKTNMNAYFSPDFGQVFLKKYVAFIPLFININNTDLEVNNKF